MSVSKMCLYQYGANNHHLVSTSKRLSKEKNSNLTHTYIYTLQNPISRAARPIMFTITRVSAA